MYELIYTSAAKRLFDPQQLGTMLERARVNNARLNVSGILLYEAGSFIQVLEGEESTVRSLLATIARDERHDRVRVVRERPIAQRSFAQWSMGFVTLDPSVIASFPKRHSLRSNGTLRDNAEEVLELLDGFRNGRMRSYLL